MFYTRKARKPEQRAKELALVIQVVMFSVHVQRLNGRGPMPNDIIESIKVSMFSNLH